MIVRGNIVLGELLVYFYLAALTLYKQLLVYLLDIPPGWHESSLQLIERNSHADLRLLSTHNAPIIDFTPARIIRVYCTTNYRCHSCMAQDTVSEKGQN